MAEPQPIDPADKAKHVAHEPDTMQVRTVALAVIGLAVVVIVAAALMAGLDDLFSIRRRGAERAVTPTMEPTLVLPATPLNPHQPLELRQLRESEEQTLSTYGWVDRKAGIARIPIDRAIDLMAKKGLRHE